MDNRRRGTVPRLLFYTSGEREESIRAHYRAMPAAGTGLAGRSCEPHGSSGRRAAYRLPSGARVSRKRSRWILTCLAIFQGELRCGTFVFGGARVVLTWVSRDQPMQVTALGEKTSADRFDYQASQTREKRISRKILFRVKNRNAGVS